MESTPKISKVHWVDASGVLGHEERGFSVWLSQNLDLLADALGLPDLTLVQRELRVESFRADILAVADDGSDDGLPVIIENQYGVTNHDHLGKVITYLAGQQRGWGVWIVERFSQAHVAAIEFLNRTSDESVGYALVRVRFAPSPEGYYVDFEVADRPNEWLKATRTATDPKTGAPERIDLLREVHARIADPLRSAGWADVILYTSRPMIELRLPFDSPLGRHGYFTLRASSTTFRFRHIAHLLDSFDESEAVINALRERYGERLAGAVPHGTRIVWHAGRDRANAANDQWYVEHPGGGYRDLKAEDAADWATAVASAWISLMNEDSPVGLIESAVASVANLED
jgi:hypothetical protein